MPTFTSPLLSWGIAPLQSRRSVDTWARRELDEHTRALHQFLHGAGDPRACAACGRIAVGGAA